MSRKHISPDTFIVVFSVTQPSSSSSSCSSQLTTSDTSKLQYPSNLPLVSHLVIKHAERDHTGSTTIKRQYTPLNLDANGFTLLVKVYEKGPMSTYLSRLQPKDPIEVAGPFVSLEYEGGKFDRIGMLAAGTGITPMYQLLQHELRQQPNGTRPAPDSSRGRSFVLLCCNRSQQDTLLSDELQEMQNQGIVKVTHCLSQPSGVPWPEDQSGRLTKCMLNKHLLSAWGQAWSEIQWTRTLILVCGPDGFCRHATNLLLELDIPDSSVLVF